MKNLLFTLFIVGFSSTLLLAQTDSINDADMKIQFQPPESWQATKKDDGYVLGSDKFQGFMKISVQPFATIKELRSAMMHGIAQPGGALLTPVDSLQNLGEVGVAGLYEGTIDGQEMRCYMMALMPPSKGRAAICISVAPKEVFNQSNIDQLKLLMRSVVFQ